jgi:hypothetical protein
MTQFYDDPQLPALIAQAMTHLPSSTQGVRQDDGAWLFHDEATLHFEAAGDALLVVLHMPERYLNAEQLTQLLTLGDHGWPLPLAASLSADEVHALLYTRIRTTDIDAEALLQAINTLLQARARWLKARSDQTGLSTRGEIN